MADNYGSQDYDNDVDDDEIVEEGLSDETERSVDYNDALQKEEDENQAIQDQDDEEREQDMS